MNLKFLGAAHEVTGSCTLLTVGGYKILIDCGLEQGPDIFENAPIPFAPGLVDFVFLTHAHIDHSGKIPLLVKNGFRGTVYSTEATAQLCSVMLMDSAHIQEQEAQWRNRKSKRGGVTEYDPLYTKEDAAAAIKLFSPCSYNKQYNVAEGVSIKFIDAGHLLGSSSIEVTATEEGVTKVILFSGDLGNIDRPLIKNPQKPEIADYVVVESTYGDSVHGERPDYADQLSEVIQRTLDRGGNVVIPSFAVGRTQELLYILRIIKERGMVKGHGVFPVYMDSPLAVEATKIYDGQLKEYYDDETLELLSRGTNPIRFDGLKVAVTSDESKLINTDPTPKVIISASGMCEAGRIRHHLKHNLWRADSTILFVGYQSAGTLGRMLTDGIKGVTLFGEYVSVNADIVKLDGISGHADRDMMLDWLSNIKKKPKKVFVNHGDEKVVKEFADFLNNSGFPTVAPYNGADFDLMYNQFVAEGNKVKIVKPEQKNGRRNNAAFERLFSAGQRLMSIIERKRNIPTKELAKMTGHITALCDKYDNKKR